MVQRTEPAAGRRCNHSMKASPIQRVCLGLAATLAVACVSAPPPASPASRSDPSASATSSPAASATPSAMSSGPRVTMSDAAACPVTQPRTAPPEIGDSLFGYSSAHGNRDLWVGGLPPKGILAADPRFVEPDGSVGMKFGWWRNVSGSLVITGRRLDEVASPLRADVPDGYGERGFVPSGVYFPTEGCWEVTGQLGAASLTFVTFVIKTA